MNLDPSFIDRFVANPEAEYRVSVDRSSILYQQHATNNICTDEAQQQENKRAKRRAE
jgi:hypothetical protein